MRQAVKDLAAMAVPVEGASKLAETWSSNVLKSSTAIYHGYCIDDDTILSMEEVVEIERRSAIRGRINVTWMERDGMGKQKEDV